MRGASSCCHSSTVCLISFHASNIRPPENVGIFPDFHASHPRSSIMNWFQLSRCMKCSIHCVKRAHQRIFGTGDVLYVQPSVRRAPITTLFVAFDLESGRVDGVFYRYGLYVLLKPLRVFVTMN